MKIEEVEKIAVDVMETTGKHSPQIILVTPKGLEMMVLMFGNDKEKDEMLKSIRVLINTRKIKQYFVINEAWVGGDLYVRPKKDPNRREILLIQEYNSDLTHKAVFREIVRKEGKVTWGKRETLDGAVDHKSIWNFYLEDAMDEGMERARLDNFLNNIPKEELDKMLSDATEQARRLFGDKVDVTEEKMKEMLFKFIKEGKLQPKKEKNGKEKNKQGV